MNYLLLFFIPITTAIAGWLTIVVTAKLLFHPLQPKKILGFTLQGAFPKRQQQLAARLGKVVSEQFFSMDAVTEKISAPEKLEKIIPVIEKHIDDFLRNRLGKEMPMIGMFIGDKTIAKLKEAFMKEIQLLFPTIMQQYTQQLKEEFDVRRLVTEKVASLSPDMIENQLFQGMKREMKLARLTGAMVGFLIGLLQVLIIWILG